MDFFIDYIKWFHTVSHIKIQKKILMFSINETKLHHPSSSFVNGEQFFNILEFPYFPVFPYFHFHVGFHTAGASLVAQTVKNSPALQETWVQSLGQEDPLEKRMATHSSILAWRTTWTEESGGIQSMGSQRVRHDWATSLSLFIFMHWRRKWQPTPVFLPGESQGRGSWWAAVCGVSQSDTTEAT